MATLILRPVADIQLNHSKSSGSNGYSLISEATADGESSYIYYEIAKNKSGSATSVFKVSGPSSNRIRISSLKLNVNAKVNNSFDSAGLTFNLYFNGIEGASQGNNLSTSFANYSKTYYASDFGFQDTIFDSFDAANLQVHVLTSLDSDKNNGLRAYVTQVYLEVTYEEITNPIYTCSAVAGSNIASASVNKGSAPAGESVTFTASVSSYCSFDGWYTASSGGTKVSGSNPYTTTLNANTTLYARAYKNTYSFALGAQPRTGRGTATLNKSTAQYPDTVTFTCTPASSEYTFYGWFSDPQGINLVSKEPVYTATATQNLTLYPKVDRLVTRTLSIPFGSGKTYLTARAVTLDFNLLVQAISCLYLSSSIDGEATFNSTAMSTLYANEIAKPVKMDVSLHCGRQGSITSALNDDDYLQFRIDGTPLETFRPNAAQDVAYTLNWQTQSAVINSSRSSTIDLYHHTRKANGSGRAVSFNDVTVTAYFIGYKNQAFIADNCPAIKSVSVSQEFSAEHDTVVFSAELAKGATWDGWYRDPACTNRVSTDIQYSVESTVDITLYGKANGGPVYTCSATAGEHVSTVSVENSKVVSGNTIQFSANITEVGWEFDGWYLNNDKISFDNPYIRTITSDVSLVAKAKQINYTITLEQADYGLAVATPSIGVYNTNSILQWEDDTGWYEFQKWQLVQYVGLPLTDADIYSTAPVSLTAYGTFEAPERYYNLRDRDTWSGAAVFPSEAATCDVLFDGVIFKDVPILDCNYKRYNIVGELTGTYTKVIGGKNNGYPFAFYSTQNALQYLVLASDDNTKEHTFGLFFTKRFTELSGVDLATQNPYTYTIIDDVNIKAVASEKPWYYCTTGGEHTNLISVSAVQGHVVAGDAVTFSYNGGSAYTFFGWYSDEECTQLVSEEENYTFTPDANVVLYAKIQQLATSTGIYIKRNGGYIVAKVVYKKENGSWVEQTDMQSVSSYLQNNNVRSVL